MTDVLRLPATQRSAASVEDDGGFSDIALSDRFVGRYGSKLRFCAVWGKWLRWDGQRWAADDTLLAYDYARRLCQEAAAQANAGNAKGIASAQTVAAVERLAKADRAIAATVDQWDAYAFLLNTPGGVVDLKTGALRPSDPNLYLTKLTGASPSGQCPLWRQFIDQITGGDVELQNYLQRAVGYSLTGDTSAHALFFGYGTGANGKSVFTSTIAGILGDYHKTAPIETFTATNTDRHPTDLAGLRGARLVTAIETEEGRRWAESKIKALTGGDVISARFMRQDFFEYTPQFKLLIVGNHKPGLRSVDEAIRRRFQLIPFAITIAPDQRDEGLLDKLKAEWPGILAWAIRGCLEWQRIGLRPPGAVVEATAAYLEAEDAIAAWIEECLDRDPNHWTSSTDLFASWKEYAEGAGEFVGSVKRLSLALESRGFAKHATNRGKGFYGLKIRAKYGSEVQK